MVHVDNDFWLVHDRSEWLIKHEIDISRNGGIPTLMVSALGNDNFGMVWGPVYGHT